MSDARFFPTRTITSQDRWVQSLSAALVYPDRVADPSLALGADEAIYEKLRRDAVCADVMLMRKHLVAGRTVAVEPGGQSRSDRMAARILDAALKEIALFPEARLNLVEAIFRGSSYALIQGGWELTRLLPESAPARWWLPRRLLDVDRRRFTQRWVPERRATRWEFWSITRQEWEPLEHPEWFVKHHYQLSEDTLGYGRGLVDSMHYYQTTKARALQDWAALVERAGQGFLDVAVDGLDVQGPVAGPGRGNDQVVTDYLDRIAKHRARHVLVHDARDKVQVLTGFQEGKELIDGLVSYCDHALRTLVLGSNLPTSADKGGSYALAEVQQGSTEALVRYDREMLGEVLTRDLGGLFWAINAPTLRQLGLADAARPRVRIATEPVENPGDAAPVVTQALAAGVPLLREEVYRKLGFRQPTGEDDVFLPPARPGPHDIPPSPEFTSTNNQTLSPPKEPGPGAAGPPDEEEDMGAAKLRAFCDLAARVRAGELPFASALAAARAAFPETPEASVRAILGPAVNAPGHRAHALAPGVPYRDHGQLQAETFARAAGAAEALTRALAPPAPPVVNVRVEPPPLVLPTVHVDARTTVAAARAPDVTVNVEPAAPAEVTVPVNVDVAPTTLNLEVDATRPGRRTLTLERDDKGRLVGGEVEEVE